MESGKKFDIAAVASIPIIMTLANSMLIPVLPLMQHKLHISSFQSSLIITIYAAIAIPFIPIAGYLSDRFGRKKIIIPSLIIVAIGGVVSGLAAWLLDDYAYWIILVGRFIQGVGAAGCFPIVLPLVGDMFKDEKDVSHSLGIVETSNTFGKVLSPIIGSALALVVWFLPFVVVPFLSIISLVAVLFFVKTPKNQQSDTQTVKQFILGIKQIIKQKFKWLFAIFIIGGISMFVLFGFLFYLSNLLEEPPHHIKGIIKGLVIAIPLCALCLSSFIAGKVVGQKKIRMKWLAVIGFLLLTSAMLTIALIEPKHLLLLISLLSMSGIGIGTALTCLDALLTEGIEKAQRGTITSLYSSMRFIGVAVGPLITSLLLGKVTSMFYIFASVSGLALILSLFAITPKK